MIIWVDADSCPVRVREIICKASKRLNIPAIFVANREIPIIKFNLCFSVTTTTESQSADLFIINYARTGDLVITRDIPFAKILTDLNISVINDRGTIFSKETINQKLSIRNFMYELQLNCLTPEKTSVFGKKEIQKFSNALDTVLRKLLKS